jgi:hypothetical protein
MSHGISRYEDSKLNGRLATTPTKRETNGNEMRRNQKKVKNDVIKARVRHKTPGSGSK